MTILTYPARALACALLSAHAAFAQTGAADAHTPVPATVYRPALEYRTDPQPAASADQGWRAANATVAGYNPMMLTMKSMGGAKPAEPHAAQRKEPAPAATHEHHQHGDQP